jgi:hypothetical protein
MPLTMGHQARAASQLNGRPYDSGLLHGHITHQCKNNSNNNGSKPEPSNKLNTTSVSTWLEG